MKRLLVICFLIMQVQEGKSQLKKGQYLIGGTGTINFMNYDRVKSFYADFSPGVGYFFIDKLPIGLRLSYLYSKQKESSFLLYESNFLSIAPFLRYYLRAIDSKLNVFTELNYSYGRGNNKGSQNSFRNTINDFLISAGPSYFINRNVALEISLNYKNRTIKDPLGTTDRNFYYIGFGLQTHLGRQ